MSNTTVSFSRRHVLGDLYHRCDSLTDQIPVYLADDDKTLVGFADEPLGHYADAMSFHLADDNCKKLSAGHFTYSLEYDHTDPKAKGSRGRVTLNSIILTGRKGYDKPVSKAAAQTPDQAS
ncbi:MAG: hypothetical protein ACRD6X_21475 [Pyrinomonadaceae bacterium]